MFARLPEVFLPNSKLVLEARDFNFSFEGSCEPLWSRNLNFSFHGPVRIAIEGLNGSGKTTFLQLLMRTDIKGSFKGSLSLGEVRAGVLDQKYELLNPDLTVLENVRERSTKSETVLRNDLAMFLFFGDSVHHPVSQLSGGERLRVALAKLLLSDPPSDVLVLDEPTNNLDMVNIEFLEALLKQYKGALIVVSHDKRFLEQLDLSDVVELKRG